MVNGVEFFRERGVRVNRSGRDMPGSNWHTYISDPDGHTVELYYGMEQIGWGGRSKPRDMHYRRFTEAPELPQPSEEAEVEEAKERGIDIESGFRDLDDMPFVYDVEGVLLPRPFKITNIGPVNIFVDDVDASVEFYTRELGFTLTEDVAYAGERFAFLRVGAEHHSLGLFPKSARGGLGLTDKSTSASFGVRVGSYEQLRNGVAFLREHGVEFIDMPPELHPGIDYAAYALDPDGHAVQLYYYMEQLGCRASHAPTKRGGSRWPSGPRRSTRSRTPTPTRRSSARWGRGAAQGRPLLHQDISLASARWRKGRFSFVSGGSHFARACVRTAWRAQSGSL